MAFVARCESPGDKPALPAEDEDRFKKLFEKLDSNKDGRIEVGELASALQKQRVSKSDAAGHAKVGSTSDRTSRRR